MQWHKRLPLAVAVRLALLLLADAGAWMRRFQPDPCSSSLSEPVPGAQRDE